MSQRCSKNLIFGYVFIIFFLWLQYHRQMNYSLHLLEFSATNRQNCILFSCRSSFIYILKKNLLTNWNISFVLWKKSSYTYINYHCVRFQRNLLSSFSVIRLQEDRQTDKNIFRLCIKFKVHSNYNLQKIMHTFGSVPVLLHV